MALFSYALPGHSTETAIFGPKTYVRHKGKPVAESATFIRPDIGDKFTLKIQNGDEEGNHRISSGNISLNGKTYVDFSDFSQQVELIEKEVSIAAVNELSVLLNSAPGSFLTITISANAVPEPAPVVSLSVDPSDIIAGESSRLTWSSENAAQVVLEPGLGQIDLNGALDISPLETTTYSVTATGPGGTANADVTITVNEPPPSIAFSTNPASIVSGAFSTLSWNTDNADTCTIDNGIGVVPNNGTISVSPTETTIYTLTATGPGGTATETVTVAVTSPAPTVIFSADPAGITTGASSTLSWTTTNADTCTIDNGIGSVAVNGSVSVSSAETTTYTLTATGPGGTTAETVTISVTAAVEPQPEGSFGAQYEDLIPPDTTVESYDHKRFALVTGKIEQTDSTPLPGVTISVGATSCVQCHGQKYGTVKTDANGQYTIPVEGGDTKTVVSKKEGYITSHRQVYVPWNDTAIVDTMRMIPFDSAGTEVGFDGNSDTVVTHKSTSVSDDFGNRSATMVFTGDNRAYEVDAGGNVIRELTNITTRATEFATPETMPAKLPPNSAYTYCVEMSVDGVERVKFDKPVVSWVDNFLGFDVGEAVPVGYYDRDRGVWVPSDNGVVVKLLDTDSDGVVDALDLTGDGAPDDLDEDGSFDDEVQGLSDPAQYAPGDTYWRFSVTHFTPWDCNWPYGPPEDGTVSNAEADPNADQQKKEEKDCKTKTNSFIEDRSRIYHEDIAIPGTDMTLHYASNRVAGYKTTITVPASGATVPASLNYILVKTEIAGRSYESLLSPLPYQTAEFTWDGLDHLGRPAIGPTVAHVDIGFVYDGIYYSAGNFEQAFSKFGSEITGLRTRQEIIIWKRFKVLIAGGNHFEAKGKGPLAGGWSISNHHYFSPKVPTFLFKGDGTGLETNAAIIETVAGTGVYGNSGDGGPASEARLSEVRGFVVDAAGNLYFCDNWNNKIRKVDTDGIITTVAGNGMEGYGGDGGPATGAKLNSPEAIALDGSGNLYIADSYNNRVRKVDVNGIITTVAGNGTEGYSDGDNLATEAMLFRPMGVAVDAAGNIYIADMMNRRVRMVDTNGILTTVAGSGLYGDSGNGGLAIEAQLMYPRRVSVDTAGNLYFTDGGNSKVYKVDSSGIITTVAGTGLKDYDGDGGLATEANLNFPVDVAVDAMRNLYITDTYHSRIRKVDANGIITTVVGSGTYGYSGDGGLATDANLGYIHGVAVDASGNIYFGDGQNYLIRKVAPPSVFQAVESSEGDISFADEENGLAHILSSTGIHKKTIDLETGITLRAFGYDAENRLITITDQFGNITTINRDADGVPTSIVSPDGLTTQLTIDVDGQLRGVTYPDNSGYSFEYTPDGLMTAETDPNGNRFEHVFDVAGRVTDILDPEEGNWNFSRSVLNNGEVVVQKTTGEGDVTTYLDKSFSGVETSTITGPSGGVSTVSSSADGLTETMSLSCGTDLELKYDLDPEYQFKYLKERTSSTPAGLSRVSLRDKTYQDTDADEVPDLITETVTVNGKASTLETNTMLTKRTATSPTGRTVTGFLRPRYPGDHPSHHPGDCRRYL